MDDLIQEVEVEETNTPSILDMSDDELANFDPSTLISQAPVTAPVETEEHETEEEGDDDVEAPAGEGASPEAAAGDADGDEHGAETTETPAAQDQPKDEQPKPAESADPIDYKAAYERLFQPFKANGKEVRVESVDDAIALMQMGANYNKKMAALKPNLKILKLLENNNLLDEDRLSFLVDLDKKNPDAITKLIKDSGIDPLEVDVNKASDYKPNTHSVSDREIELDNVLQEIQDSPTYTQTINIVTNEWDGPSKQIVANNPQLLKVIDGHLSSGIYELISAEVSRERMFGRLNGLSDLEAYRQVGDAMNARGGFDHLNKRQPIPAKPEVAAPAPKAADPKLKDKKRAASSTKPVTPAPKTPEGFNPLGLSDAEFSKLVIDKLL